MKKHLPLVCIGLSLLFWGLSFYFLNKVKDGRKIFILNLVLMMALMFVVPGIFTKALALSIVYWMPGIPVIYGFVMLVFSLLITYIKDENEQSPFRFSLLGTLIAWGLCGWFFYFLMGK